MICRTAISFIFLLCSKNGLEFYSQCESLYVKQKIIKNIKILIKTNLTKQPSYSALSFSFRFFLSAETLTATSRSLTSFSSCLARCVDNASAKIFSPPGLQG